MRNIPAGAADQLPGRMVATGNEYPERHRVPRHRHRRAQFLYAANGVMLVATDAGRWIVPPERAVWIPSGLHHEVTALGSVSTRSLYVDPDVSDALPGDCRVLAVSPLMRHLLLEAVDLPADSAGDPRAELILSLIVREIERAPVLPLDIPFPTDPDLAARCRAYIEHPSPHETIDDWARDLALSRRTFTRRFRAETGLSFAVWCRQACILAALPRLAKGESITRLAFDFGYDSASAFTTMFRRVMGVAPSRYLSTGRNVR